MKDFYTNSPDKEIREAVADMLLNNKAFDYLEGDRYWEAEDAIVNLMKQIIQKEATENDSVPESTKAC